MILHSLILTTLWWKMKYLWMWIGRYAFRIWITVRIRDLACNSTIHTKHKQTNPIFWTCMKAWVSKSETSSKACPKSNMILWCNKFGPEKLSHPIYPESITVILRRDSITRFKRNLIRDLLWSLFLVRGRRPNQRSVRIRYTKKPANKLSKRRTTGKRLRVDGKEHDSSGINSKIKSLISKPERTVAKE